MVWRNRHRAGRKKRAKFEKLRKTNVPITRIQIRQFIYPQARRQLKRAHLRQKYRDQSSPDVPKCLSQYMVKPRRANSEDDPYSSGDEVFLPPPCAPSLPPLKYQPSYEFVRRSLTAYCLVVSFSSSKTTSISKWLR